MRQLETTLRIRPLARKLYDKIADRSLRLGGDAAYRIGLRNGPLRGIKWHRAEASRPGTREGADTSFVAELHGGRTYGDYGVVLTPDRYMLGDVSPAVGRRIEQHDALKQPWFPRPQNLPGRAAVLSSHAHQRYYHWMLEVLPRLEILERHGVAFDRLIVNYQTKYQAESLSLLGIPSDRVIAPREGELLEPETLLVPSLPGEIGFPTQRSVDFLRSAFAKHVSSSGIGRLLYISRDDALTRRARNETQILDMLERLGFEKVSLEGVRVTDQIRMFSEARLVVGPHGAGLTNIVFMQPDSLGLIEFMPTTYEHNGFADISQLMSLPYARMSCESSSSPEHDMIVPVEQLHQLVSRRLARGLAACV